MARVEYNSSGINKRLSQNATVKVSLKPRVLSAEQHPSGPIKPVKIEPDNDISDSTITNTDMANDNNQAAKSEPATVNMPLEATRRSARLNPSKTATIKTNYPAAQRQNDLLHEQARAIADHTANQVNQPAKPISLEINYPAALIQHDFAHEQARAIADADQQANQVNTPAKRMIIKINYSATQRHRDQLQEKARSHAARRITLKINYTAVQQRRDQRQEQPRAVADLTRQIPNIQNEPMLRQVATQALARVQQLEFANAIALTLPTVPAQVQERRTVLKINYTAAQRQIDENKEKERERRIKDAEIKQQQLEMKRIKDAKLIKTIKRQQFVIEHLKAGGEIVGSMTKEEYEEMKAENKGWRERKQEYEWMDVDEILDIYLDAGEVIGDVEDVLRVYLGSERWETL